MSSLVVAILSLWYCASNRKNNELRFAENELAIFKESIKVLINPALTEESMSRAPAHKRASIIKFPRRVRGARFTKKRSCNRHAICKLWSEGAIARVSCQESIDRLWTWTVLILELICSNTARCLSASEAFHTSAVDESLSKFWIHQPERRGWTSLSNSEIMVLFTCIINEKWHWKNK